MSGLRGNPKSLRELAKRLQASPKVLAQRTAARVAPVLSSLAQTAYDAGTTVYGDGRPAGVHGDALDLFESGRTRGFLGFAATGTQVRCVINTRASRYLIGKYRILPMGALPFAWSQAIGKMAAEEASVYYAQRAA